MKILTIIGARPQFIKASVVNRALRERGFEETIVHTGQHFDSNMSDIFFEELGIPKPNYYLNIHSLQHGAMTGRMLEQIEKLIIDLSPDKVLVYGDTNSTLAGALAASKLHIPVAHIEAGLRSYNKKMPEEINRILTDNVSDWLFVPTKTAFDNLCKEGVKEEKIHLVGDVMYDVALYYSVVSDSTSTICQKHTLQRKSFILATIHRAENTNEINRLNNIITCLAALSKKYRVIFPIHPRTKNILDNMSMYTANIEFITPVGYLDMIALEKNAALVITDSGGVQKEAYFYKTPCVTLRSETEWTELIKYGWNTLMSPDTPLNSEVIESKINSQGIAIELYGQGNAAIKIANILKEN